MPPHPRAPERQRRAPAEIHDLILDAARSEFSRQGYRGATYRDIATVAGVARSVVHRNFVSKAELFAEAVVEPFVRGFEELSNDWMVRAGDPLGDEELIKVFVSDVLSGFAEHKHALEQLASGRAQMSEATTLRIRSVFDRLFAQMRMVAELETRRRGRIPSDGLDLPIRVLVCMIAGASAFGWLLLPEADHDPVSPEARDTLAKVGLWGIAREPRA